MKKKRLTKGEKKIVEDLCAKQSTALRYLRERTEFLIKRSEEMLTKINGPGIDTNYSISSDIFRIAEDVFRAELTLSQLRAIQTGMEYDQKK